MINRKQLKKKLNSKKAIKEFKLRELKHKRKNDPIHDKLINERILELELEISKIERNLLIVDDENIEIVRK